MPETVAVISTYQTPFALRDLRHTFVEQVQQAAVGVIDLDRMPDGVFRYWQTGPCLQALLKSY